MIVLPVCYLKRILPNCILGSENKLKDECLDITVVCTTYTVALQLRCSVFVYIAHLFDCIFQVIIFKTSFIKED